MKLHKTERTKLLRAAPSPDEISVTATLVRQMNQDPAVAKILRNFRQELLLIVELNRLKDKKYDREKGIRLWLR